MDNDNKDRIDKLAHDVLMLSRNTLLVNLRFLDMALSSLELVRKEDLTLMTDGKRLIYSPIHILKCYRAEKEIPVRDYLHVILHCVYRHLFVNPMIKHTIWDLSCDIAVENIISELGLDSTKASRENAQKTEIQKIKSETGFLTAEKIYGYYIDKGISETEAALLRGTFYADDHRAWYMTADEKQNLLGISGKSGNKNQSQSQSQSQNQNQNGGGQTVSLQLETSGAELSQMWKDISERMQQDLETFSKRQGDTAGSMMQNLREVNREKYDYTAFLKKFAVMGEAMKINDDEFDYIFYTYGLKLYDKMPLVEPLEYKDVKRIREFVIAIDTSGSTSGELVQKFLNKTYNILKSTESFFTKMNLHIIQCDAEVQEHVKITSQEDFDRYLSSMKILGLGGTDFRPVFALTDELVKNGEFTNLKGLIYFTDGFGEFPQKMPGYRTAFVFIDDDYNNYDVPPWAIKLILKQDEI